VDQPTRIGRYDVIGKVGRGGMGSVYHGHDAVLEREVAIKVMSGDFSSDEAARVRFFREARAAARLQHRNIVTIFEFGEEETTPYIVMEFLKGQDLARRMRQEPPLTIEQKLEIVAELCTGLHFAHEQGVVHRDVKPANVWLLPDGSVKLLDFGIAKVASSTSTRQGAVLGSASYMAPEQVSGGSVDARSDIFSVGVLLYELLSGRRPFEADSPTAVLARIMEAEPAPLDRLVPGLPRPLVGAVARALQKDPNRRYARAADLGADLRIIRTSLDRPPAIEAAGPVEPVRDAGPAAEVPTDHAGSITLQPAAPIDPFDADSLTLHREPPTVVARPAATRMWLPLAVVVAMIGVGAFVILNFQGPVGDAVSHGSGGRQADQKAAVSDDAARVPTPGRILTIVSEPPGAGIVIDGAETGRTTPADIAIGAAAPSEVRLTRQGAPPVSVPVTAAELVRGRIDVKLPAVPRPDPVSVVTLTGPYPFEVLADDRVISPAAGRHEVSVSGRRVLRVRAGDVFLNQQYPVEATGRPIVLRAPDLGRLTIRTPYETCRLALDGQDIGYPPVANLPVAAGTHRVVQTCGDGAGRQLVVTIGAGASHTEYIR